MNTDKRNLHILTNRIKQYVKQDNISLLNGVYPRNKGWFNI